MLFVFIACVSSVHVSLVHVIGLDVAVSEEYRHIPESTTQQACHGKHDTEGAAGKVELKATRVEICPNMGLGYTMAYERTQGWG